MKEFDIEKAKAGAPVCTREGRKVRIVCFDVKGDKYPIMALAEKTISELKTIGVGNFVDGANWIKVQLSQSEVTKISEQVPSLLDLKLMDCPLSVRTLNALRLWDKPTKDLTLKDLVGCTKKELLGARNFGNTMLKEVEDFLTRYGLKLKGE